MMNFDTFHAEKSRRHAARKAEMGPIDWTMDDVTFEPTTDATEETSASDKAADEVMVTVPRRTAGVRMNAFDRDLNDTMDMVELMDESIRGNSCTIEVRNGWHVVRDRSGDVIGKRYDMENAVKLAASHQDAR